MKNLLFSISLTIVVTTAFGQVNYLDKGNSYLNNKEYEKAEQAFRDGIKSDPTNLIYQCQLGLTLINQKKYSDAEQVLNKVLEVDSNNVGAIWYSGIGNFYNSKDRQAINRFEKALTLLDKKSGQYYSANWFIGKCYQNLLYSEGLSFEETNRMLETYKKYIELQPNAEDYKEVAEFIKYIEAKRPPDNVKKWLLTNSDEKAKELLKKELKNE